MLESRGMNYDTSLKRPRTASVSYWQNPAKLHNMGSIWGEYFSYEGLNSFCGSHFYGSLIPLFPRRRPRVFVGEVARSRERGKEGWGESWQLVHNHAYKNHAWACAKIYEKVTTLKKNTCQVKHPEQVFRKAGGLLWQKISWSSMPSCYYWIWL